jgi:predicted nucleotidyltransferase
LGTHAVIIGAMAYRLFIEDANRLSFDIDLAIALDLEAFEGFKKASTVLGWRQDERQEQRWLTARGNRLDLLPAGPSIRKQRRLKWPRSGFVMSLAGFDHVFQNAARRDIGGGLIYSVVPPPVLALLKIVSYLDDPQRRAKDLLDFRGLLKHYQRDSERIFSDAVFRADLPDVEFASAFLLGRDLGEIANPEDFPVINIFIRQMANLPRSASMDDDWHLREVSHFQSQLSAFSKGLERLNL